LAIVVPTFSDKNANYAGVNTPFKAQLVQDILKLNQLTGFGSDFEVERSVLGILKEGSITVPFTSCLAGSESAV
jgi:hypothetical protein